MDDIMNIVNQIMSDPEQMNQLSSLASSLGLSPDSPNENSTPTKADTSPSTSSLPFTEDTLASLLPLIQRLQNSTDDKYITFLRSLQPILSEERRPKVDHAILFLKLLSFVPYLEESGILPKNNIFNTIRNILKGVFP